MRDIYFNENYGKLYEGHEKGQNEVYKFENEYGSIQHMFIKREIPQKINGVSYYDLITPYGYGGPLIINCEEQYKESLIKEYKKDFDLYCKENKIISEFIRFHPLEKNVEDFKGLYDITYSGKTVGTNLIDYEDPFQKEFSKSSRKNVRRALRDGVSYKITEKPKDVNKFMEVYYSTMKRNEARDFYYFDETYFEKTIHYFKDNLLIIEAIYDDKVIGMGLYFVYKEYIHVHLSGTLTEYLYLSPDYVLQYAVTQWGKENEYKLIHQGGGRTDSDEDTLYKFKKQFGRNTDFLFHIGKKIRNNNIYKQLCDINNVEEDIDFFPAYRTPKSN